MLNSSVSGSCFYLSPPKRHCFHLHPPSLTLSLSLLHTNSQITKSTTAIEREDSERQHQNQSHQDAARKETSSSNEENHKHVRNDLGSEHRRRRRCRRQPTEIRCWSRCCSRSDYEDVGNTQNPQKTFFGFRRHASLPSRLLPLQTLSGARSRHLHVQVPVPPITQFCILLSHRTHVNKCYNFFFFLKKIRLVARTRSTFIFLVDLIRI